MIELPSLNKHIYSRYVLLLSLQKMSLSFRNRVILSTILISTHNWKRIAQIKPITLSNRIQ